MSLPFPRRACVRHAALGTVLVSALLVSGCQTVNGEFYWPWETPQVDNAQQELALQQAQHDEAVRRSQIEGLSQSQRTLVERLDRLEMATRDNAKMHDEIVALRRELEQMRSERETMRKEIVDDLTTRINQFMAKATSGPPAGRGTGTMTQSGHKHTVEAGQTLTDIAKAYKTTTAAILKANNLKSSTVRAGQVLFIPE